MVLKKHSLCASVFWYNHFMALSWSTKRRFMYGLLLIILTSGFLGFVYYKTLYRAPTCTDGVKNGDEMGVDCGGSCSNICTTDTLSPIVLWAKPFLVVNNVYNLAAYVENPNVNSKNTTAEYTFSVYDENHQLIGIRTGQTFIPKNKRFVVFEPSFTTGARKAKTVDFQFTKLGTWVKDTTKDPLLAIQYSPLSGTSTVPRIDGTITNNSLSTVKNVELVALVLDNKENVVAVSRTFVDDVAKSQSQDFVFMWPRPFNLGVEACVNPVDVSLVLDRSGSMMSEGKNPPEPFTTVKQTAKEFIKNLYDDSSVGFISFGTNAFEERMVSSNKQDVISAIDSFALATGTQQQQTNIGEGIQLASQQLRSGARSQDNKVIVLLTDGIPTEPRSSQIDYPRIYAESMAREASASGITIYTIGLGKSVNEGFLKTIAGSPDRYFFAPTKETLSSIYTRIGSSLCEKKPNAITIIYRIF